MSPPPSSDIDKWMFYAVDRVGKSTVVCINERYFATFRHGTHLEWKENETKLRIYPAKCAANHAGYEVTVVYINETADLVILRSNDIVVPVNLIKILKILQLIIFRNFLNWLDQKNLKNSCLPDMVISQKMENKKWATFTGIFTQFMNGAMTKMEKSWVHLF
jgi:hypothetical protein